MRSDICGKSFHHTAYRGRHVRALHVGRDINSDFKTPVLGRCNSRGVIALSSVLVFLPEELREYVICHELAHLDEMNHSPRFHALCDKYCRGRERQLEAALKAAVIPIV